MILRQRFVSSTELVQHHAVIMLNMLQQHIHVQQIHVQYVNPASSTPQGKGMHLLFESVCHENICKGTQLQKHVNRT